MTMLKRIQCDRCYTVIEGGREVSRNAGWGGYSDTNKYGESESRDTCPNCRTFGRKSIAKDNVRRMRAQLEGLVSEEQLADLDILLNGTGIKRPRRSKSEPVAVAPQPKTKNPQPQQPIRRRRNKGGRR